MEKVCQLLQSKAVLVIVGIFILVGLFFLKSDLAETRLEKEIWNLGHIFAFFIVWMFLMNIYCTFYPTSLLRTARILIVSLIAGSVIEIIQHYIGRSASFRDIGLDLAGTLIALSLMIKFTNSLKRLSKYVILLCILIISVLTFPSVRIFLDEVNIARQFPILSDFTTPFELSRWSSYNARLSIEEINSKRSLKVRFSHGKRYSSIKLKAFEQNWFGFKQLALKFNNPENRELNLDLRIHDREHKKSHYAFHDRFRRKIKLPAGRSEVSIDLIDLHNAPRNRKMDLTKIDEIILLAENLEEDKKLVLDKIYLR